MHDQRTKFLMLLLLVPLSMAQHASRSDYYAQRLSNDWSPEPSYSQSPQQPPLIDTQQQQYHVGSNDRLHFGRYVPPLSLWSGAPIVVGYGDVPNDGYVADSERSSNRMTPAYLPTEDIHELQRQQPEQLQWRQRLHGPQAKVEANVEHRANNHNYDNIESYKEQQEVKQFTGALDQDLQLLQREQERQQRELIFDNARRNAYVRADPDDGYLESPLPLHSSGFHPEKYAAHFRNYLQKFPSRLQPIFN